MILSLSDNYCSSAHSTGNFYKFHLLLETNENRSSPQLIALITPRDLLNLKSKICKPNYFGKKSKFIEFVKKIQKKYHISYQTSLEAVLQMRQCVDFFRRTRRQTLSSTIRLEFVDFTAVRWRHFDGIQMTRLGVGCRDELGALEIFRQRAHFMNRTKVQRSTTIKLLKWIYNNFSHL